ncbi:MAG: heterodisulfide reductase-related iron-sulfur binding cluster, partial [Anaerolineae bacterium]|nr:heterodisulfide reductase-related iron-sulfur binding cluster [Anaerolineae bacterium]
SGLTASLANWGVNNRIVRWGLENYVGISRQRHLPQFAPVPFTRWFKHRPRAGNGQRLGSEEPRAKKVVLFNDTFNTYNYPHVAIAATEVLEAAGFEVILPGHKCCGRPMISKGLVNKARRAAKDTISRLVPLAEQGLPIVGLEPSCILSMRDEYFYLLPQQRSQVELVSERCYTFEEFMTKLADDGELRLNFRAEPQEILLHGHCQQKALVGSAPGKRALELVPGFQVSEVDSGCCGMAGSFGYEAEHYEISMAMAERRLLPAIRQQKPETIIAAAGVSCRQQIRHGSGRQARHPAEILRAVIA